MSTDEKRIREFAYQIWESEGRPDGHEERHWEMARRGPGAEPTGQRQGQTQGQRRQTGCQEPGKNHCQAD